MEAAEGIHRVSTQTVKPVHLYVLEGEERTLLLDTGTAQTPEEVIVPYFEKNDINVDGPLDVVITHADCDHCGGDHGMKRLYPRCRIHVSFPDRAMVEDPAKLMSERYGAHEELHGLTYDEDTKRWLAEAAGLPQEADSVLVSGQRIRMGDDWEVEVMPLLGHTHGHFMVWDPRHRIAFVGDGVLGHGEYDLEGNLHAPPVYVTVRGYLESIERLEHLAPDALFLCHRDPIMGEEVLPFLEESRGWVRAAGTSIERVLRSRRGVSLSEMIEEVSGSGELGTFAMPIDLMYPLVAHLAELERRGNIRSEPKDGVPHYYRS